jgi:hypothetical protein
MVTKQVDLGGCRLQLMEGCQYRTSKQRIVVKDYLNRTRLAMQIYGVVSGFRCQVSEKNKKAARCWNEAAAGSTACRAEALEAKAGTLKP